MKLSISFLFRAKSSEDLENTVIHAFTEGKQPYFIILHVSVCLIKYFLIL